MLLDRFESTALITCAAFVLISLPVLLRFARWAITNYALFFVLFTVFGIVPLLSIVRLQYQHAFSMESAAIVIGLSVIMNVFALGMGYLFSYDHSPSAVRR